MQKRNLREILLTLFESNHLLSAQRILELLEKKDRAFNKTSVYRMLEQLVTDGLLCKHFFSENTAVYELSAHHHAHLLCTECGTVSEGPCQMPDVETIGDFTVDHHHVTILGICGNCSRKYNKGDVVLL